MIKGKRVNDKQVRVNRSPNKFNDFSRSIIRTIAWSVIMRLELIS